MPIKNACFIAVMSFFVLSIAVIEAGAESPKTAHVAIPFEFLVQGNCLPAGDYIIQHVESTSYLLFRSRDGKNVVSVFALPVDEDPAADADSKLIFRVENGKHYLYGGWGPFGRRVVSAESALPAPSGVARIEVPITFTQESRQ